MSIFGTIITAPTVEAWVVAQLQKWVPDYLPEVARQAGLPKIPPHPRTYTRKSTIDKFPEDQLPLITVVSPGTAERPAMEGDGLYRSKWTVNVASIVSARTEVATRDLAGVFGMTVAAILLQHPNLHDGIESIDWLGESRDDVPAPDERTLQAHIGLYHVEVRGVLNRREGPASPSTSPQQPGTAPQDPGDWEPAEEVFIDGRLAAHS